MLTSPSPLQGQHAQTAAVEGRFANWQETLILEAEHEQDLHFDMASVADQLELRLYDRVVAPLQHDNRELNTVHEQWEHRLLGEASLPFAAVFAQAKLDGLLAVRKPAFHSEYK